MNPGTAPILVPPRPNLGPEPLAEWPSILANVLFVALTLIMLYCAISTLYMIWRGQWRDRRLRSVSTWPSIPESPRDRIIAWSKLARDALDARYGPSWRAKTTVEIAGDSALAALLGPELSAELIDLLSAADRVKFDDPDAPHPEVRESYRELVAALRPLPPEAGARSRIKGK